MNTVSEIASDIAVAHRYELAQRLAREAGVIGMEMFRRREQLEIEQKGVQDMVSIADRAIEDFIREHISREFPSDGVLGEERGGDSGQSRIWVIDPIDGTACFVNGMHAWCISIGVLIDGEPCIGVVYDPNADELFHARKGHGAYVDHTRLNVHHAHSLRDGVLGVGFSHRVKTPTFIPFLQRVLEEGGMFIRNGSGALMIAYVAAGRLIGYFEPHINSWDCLAGIVLVHEAGGVCNRFFDNDGLLKGNPILAAGSTLYKQLEPISLPFCTPAVA
jgi:myo-inositol-1(or 4)-monophosphatase